MSTAFEARVVRSSGRAEPAPFGADEILLTPQQKRLIRESFMRLEPALDLVGQLFFLKLYRLDPALRLTTRARRDEEPAMSAIESGRFRGWPRSGRGSPSSSGPAPGD